jgi:hypothetical protein
VAKLVVKTYGGRLQVYAYTSSPLQYAILRLFVRCECILPNLFVGTITRESVTSAFTCGLSADQVIDYLRQHASQHISKRVPVVPEVTDALLPLCFFIPIQMNRHTEFLVECKISLYVMCDVRVNFACTSLN